MEKFVIKKPLDRAGKGVFSVSLDLTLQDWIRDVADENDVTVSEATRQIVRFAKTRYLKK